MENKSMIGHIAALITIVIWGTTFISTKILLVDFQPVEILFIRFIMGFLALFLVCPRRLRGTDLKQEFTLAGAGLCGICLYYLLENIALTYTLAQNVGVIISVAPFFTAILSRVFDEYDLSGIGRVGPLFCYLEFCGEDARSSEDQCVYLYGAGDHRDHFRTYSGRTDYVAVRRRHPSDAGRIIYL